MARRPWLLLALLLSLIASINAATPTSFCKCTCFSNSTLIQLTGSKDPEDMPDRKGKLLMKSGTCDDCNRQFCLSQELPICAKAKEEDVFTTCFQRDSAKDEAVVFIFIFATAGLLAWAAARPWVQPWIESRIPRKDYTPVNNEGQ
ncbi:hypothetical protein CAC42_4217 [Sphaceloma murrayae]|uniref:Uncharacterized protein n=1 Tax=Sphaceloma murrayae TaxID=2082308 RepID=A0A2K1QKT8_9PEZI|nr:hypothetical protein CAC42_4217 [Sphaceloma murrayae]